MKTRKKVLIALLSATCMIAGAVGLAACKGDAQDSALYNVYNQYVATVPSGETPKTYEQWLKDVLDSVATPGKDGKDGEDGEDGEDGKDGKPGSNGKSAYELYSDAEYKAGRTPLPEADWLASLVGASGITPSIGTNGNWYLGTSDTGVKAAGVDGEDGVSITKVEMSADGKSLALTFSNSETPVLVPLPDEVTHVHTQSSEYKVLIPATPDTEGLGYTVCTSGDGHIELVVIPTYSYKINAVKMPTTMEGEEDLEPALGLTVKLVKGDKTISAEMDDKGYAYFNDVAMDEYTVQIDGYDLILLNGDIDVEAGAKTDKGNHELTFVVKEKLPEDSGSGTEQDPYVLSASLNNEMDVEYYYLVPAKTERYGYQLNGDVYVTFTPSVTGKYALYEISGIEYKVVRGGNYVKEERALYLREDEQITVRLKSDDTVNTALFVMLCLEEKMAVGSSKYLPVKFAPDTDVTVTSDMADEDGIVYLDFTGRKKKANTNIDSSYKFTSTNADVALSYIAFVSYQPVLTELELDVPVSGIGLSSYTSNYDAHEIQLTLPDGVESATLKAVTQYDPGENRENAIDLVFDTETTAVSGYNTVWYKYVVTTAGIQTLRSENANATYILYNEAGEQLESMNSAVYPYNFAAGTYYIKAEINKKTFKVAAYDETTDAGLTKYALAEISVDTATTARYYTFTAETAGEYLVRVTPAPGKGVNPYSFYSDEFETALTVTDGVITLEADQTIYLDCTPITGGGYYSVTLARLTDEVKNIPVNYNFTVKNQDNKVQADIVVKAGDQQGTTDASGKVTLALVPGNYEVELEFPEGQENNYAYTTTVTTPKNYSREIAVEINISTLANKSVNVKCNYAAVNGVSVSLYKITSVGDKGDSEPENTYELVGTEETANGTVTFTILGSTSNYRLKISNVPAGYAYTGAEYISFGSNVTNISLDAITEETVTVVGSDEPQSGVKVALYKGTELVEEKTTGADGTVKFTIVGNKSSYSLKVSNIPEGFTYPEDKVTFKNTITLQTPTPDNPDNPDPVQPVEEYKYIYTGWEQEVDGEQTFKLFTSAASRDYTIQVHGGYIKYLRTEYTDYFTKADMNTEWVIDGKYNMTEASMMANPNKESDSNGNICEFGISSYSDGFVNAKFELVICAYDGQEATVTISKVNSRES